MLKNLIIVIGKMGSGKTTIVERASSIAGIDIIKTTTSRPRRDNEGDNSYIFVGEDYFIDNKDSFIEYKSYNTVFGKWYYGVEYDNLTTIKQDKAIIVLSPLGCRDLINNLKVKNSNIKTTIIHVRADKDIRLNRTVKRGDKIEEILRRFETDEKDFLYVEGLDAIYLDNNYNLKESIENFIGIVESVCKSYNCLN